MARITRKHVANAQCVNEMSQTYIKQDGRFISIDELPYNDAGQTPREVYSFTFALGHLISTSGGSFITAATDEALWYISDACVRDYEDRVRQACERANVRFPEAAPVEA